MLQPLSLMLKSGTSGIRYKKISLLADSWLDYS